MLYGHEALYIIAGTNKTCARPPLRYGARAEHCRAVKRPPLKLQNALRAERAHALS